MIQKTENIPSKTNDSDFDVSFVVDASFNRIHRVNKEGKKDNSIVNNA
jgi:hypothetical protein